MAGYVIMHNEITDEALHAEFREKVAAAIASYGGKYLARGGAVEVIDGDWHPERIIIAEFESVDAARTYLNSPEYDEMRELRSKAANAIVVLVEGV